MRRVLGHIEGGLEQRILKPRPAGVDANNPHQTISAAKDIGPDLHHLRGAHPRPLHPGVPLGAVPTVAGLLHRPAGLFEQEIPHLVRIFDIGLAARVQIVTDIGGKGLDIGVISGMRHVEPWVRPDLIGQLDHDLDRDTATVECIVLWCGPFAPVTDKRSVGDHPIHKPHHPQIADQGHPARIKGDAHIKQVDVILVNNRDVADVVGGFGFLDGNGNRAVAWLECESDLAGGIAHVPRPATHAQDALPVIGQPVAPGEILRLAGQVSQHIAFQLFDALGGFHRPAVFIQIAFVL